MASLLFFIILYNLGSASSSAVKTHKASSSGTTTASETSGFNSRPLGATVVVTTDTSPEKPSLGTALEETNLFNFSSVDCELLDLSASSFILRFWTDSGPTDFSEYTEWSHFEPEPNAVHVPGDVFVSRR